MLLTKGLSLLALPAASVLACGRDNLHSQVFNPHVALSKRQETTFPPVLDQNEAILLDSFDNATIESWSYYYTHGLHMAGTNKSMAQWTANRWNEYGFTADLDSYCTCSHCPSTV